PRTGVRSRTQPDGVGAQGGGRGVFIPAPVLDEQPHPPRLPRDRFQIVSVYIHTACMPRRTPEQALQTKRRLVRTARGMFAKHASPELRTEMLVKAARVTRGALYHHFETKAHLFEAVVEEAMHDLRQQLADAAGGARNPSEALERTLRSFLLLAASPA